MDFQDSSAEFNEFMELLDKNSYKEIGKGSYATVYMGINRFTSEYYAIKKNDKRGKKSRKRLERFSRESRVLENNQSPYLLKSLGKFETEDHFILITEYAAGGDFWELCYKRPNHRFTEDEAQVCGAEIVHAIKELHSRGIIHRDIKQENILIDKDGHLKLADFGLCKDGIDEDHKAKTFCGTRCTLAPEVVMEEEYDFAADWWSFGILLYEMIVGKLPFEDDDRHILYDKIINTKPKIPKTLRPETKDLLRKLLEKNPEKRLGSGPQGVENILKHPFFNKINWEDVDEKKIDPPFGKIDGNNNNNL